MGRIGNWFKGAFNKVRGVARKVIGGVKKILPTVTKLAPVAGKLISKIPHPIAQGVGRGLQVAGTVANTLGS